jgi:predicted outer membrane repeat protein
MLKTEFKKFILMLFATACFAFVGVFGIMATSASFSSLTFAEDNASQTFDQTVVGDTASAVYISSSGSNSSDGLSSANAVLTFGKALSVATSNSITTIIFLNTITLTGSDPANPNYTSGDYQNYYYISSGSAITLERSSTWTAGNSMFSVGTGCTGFALGVKSDGSYLSTPQFIFDGLNTDAGLSRAVSNATTATMIFNNVTFQNFLYSSTGSFYILYSNGNLTFNNVTVQNNSSSAQASSYIFVDKKTDATLYPTVNILNSTFNLNTAERPFCCSNCLTVNISNSNFTDNLDSNSSGGAVYINLTSNVNITSCEFNGNEISTSGANGGAVYISADTISITGTSTAPTIFENNSSVSSTNIAGGGLYATKNSSTTSSITMNYVDFTDNAASGNGSGAYITNFATVTANNLNFNNNNETSSSSNTYGGGLCLIGCTQVDVSSSSFTGNTAKYGGGIYVSSSSVASFEDITVESNQASMYGGGLHVISISGSISFLRCSFENNVSYADGGGIFFGNTVKSISFVSCTISGNSSTSDSYDGIICGDSGSTILENFVVKGCSFINQEDGSALSVFLSSSGTGIITKATSADDSTITNEDGVRTTFSGNAQAAGLSYGDWTIEYTNVENNSCSTTGIVAVRGATSLLVNDCSFVDNSQNIGALYVYNTANVYIGLNDGNDETSNVTFSGNDSANHSGAICFGGTISLVVIDDCLFENNITETSRGGAFFAESAGTELYVKNSKFINNSAYTSGGAIYSSAQKTVISDNCTFSGNIAQTGSGGAVVVSSAQCIIEDSTFDDSYVNSNNVNVGNYSGYDGGAIYYNCSAGNFEMKNCKVLNNTAKRFGGGLYLFENYTGIATISNCEFSYNKSAHRGSAINVDSFKLFTMNDCKISYNTITTANMGRYHCGGALFLYNSNAIINNSDFFQNNSLGIGGGILFVTSNQNTFEINGGSIYENKINISSTSDRYGLGGGVGMYTTGQSSATVTANLNNVNIYSNAAMKKHGGGIFAFANSGYGTVLLSLSGCTISDNSVGSGYNGSAIYGDNFSSLVIDDTTITNQKSSGSLNVIYAVGAGTFSMTDSTISNNVIDVAGGYIVYTSGLTLDFSSDSFKGNSVTSGLIYYPIAQSVSFVGVNFINNKVVGLNAGLGLFTISSINHYVYGCTFSGNIGSEGYSSALYFSGSNYAYTVENCNFYDNTSDMASAVYVNPSSAKIKMIFVGCVFEGNSATNAGAVRTYDDTVFKNCTFDSNTAEANGGAVYGQKITLENCEFSNNSATNENCEFSNNSATNGGAIYLSGTDGSTENLGMLIVDKDSIFKSNNADCGGAIYVNKYCSAKISGASFIQNNTSSTDSRVGGAVYNLGTVVIDGSSFSQNGSSNALGGAIANANSLELSNSTFTGNLALNGGAIYAFPVLTLSSELTVDNCVFSGNSATSGGSLVLLAGSFDILDSSFSAGSATNGGAIAFTGSTTVAGNLLSNTFNSNSATNGGAINFSNANATITVQGLTATGNTASLGGAIYISAGNVAFEDISVSGNNTSNLGAGMYVSGGTVDISRGIAFENNFKNGTSNSTSGAYELASGSKSNVYLASGGVFKISNSLSRDSSIGVLSATTSVATGTDDYKIESMDYYCFSSDDETTSGVYYRYDSNAILSKTFETGVIPFTVSDYFGDTENIPDGLSGVTIEVKIYGGVSANVFYSASATTAPTSTQVVLTSAGTKTVYYSIQAEGYNDVSGSAKIILKGTENLFISDLPTVENVYAGVALSNATILGGSATYRGLMNIAGTFAWKNSALVPSTIGYQTLTMTFTPNNSDYETVTFDILVDVLGYDTLYFYNYYFYVNGQSSTSNYNTTNALSISVDNNGLSNAMAMMNDGGTIYMQSTWRKVGDIYVDNKTVILAKEENFSGWLMGLGSVTGTINIGKKNMTGTIIFDGNNISSDNGLIYYFANDGFATSNINIYNGIVLRNCNATFPALCINNYFAVTIYGIEIYNCSNTGSTYQYGGILSSFGVTTQLTIYNANIHDNFSYKGAGISINYGTATIYDAEIYNCSAYYGGGIYLGSGATATIYNANLHDNTATVLETVTTDDDATTYSYEGGQGGGIYIATFATVNVYKMTVKNNTAVYGGGIYVSDGRSAGIFGYNSTNQITVVGNSAVESLQTEDGENYYYYGGYGGGIYSAYQFHLSYAIIANNTASVYGGGVYEEGLNKDTRSYTSTITNSSIYGNMVVNLHSSDVGGGAIYMQQMTLTNVDIFDNGILNLYDSTATINMYGGAIYGAKGLGSSASAGTYYSAGGDKTFVNCNIYDNFIDTKYENSSYVGYGAGLALMGDIADSGSSVLPFTSFTNSTIASNTFGGLSNTNATQIYLTARARLRV